MRRTSDVWWVWTVDPTDNRLIILGWDNSQPEAERLGMEKLQGMEFKTIALRTTDRRYAKDQINARRLGESANLEDIIRKRAKYKV